MQELINELSKGWRAERSLSQMTLGRFISELEKLPQDKDVCDLGGNIEEYFINIKD